MDVWLRFTTLAGRFLYGHTNDGVSLHAPSQGTSDYYNHLTCRNRFGNLVHLWTSTPPSLPTGTAARMARLGLGF